jgi:sugar/nucleoside kinase (ribokinase family)
MKTKSTHNQSSSSPVLVCVGNVIVDVFSSVDEDIDLLLGLKNSVSHVDYETISKILVTLPNPKISAGGGASNTAKIASFLNADSAFIGSVGTKPSGEIDSMGNQFIKEMTDAEVTPFLKQGKNPTGVCTILQKADGKIIIAACPSAALELEPEDIDENLIRGAKVLVIDGYMLGREKLMYHLLETADRFGTAIALDVGSAEIVKQHAHAILQYCRLYPMILFMNEEEAYAFYNIINGKELSVPKNTAKKFLPSKWNDEELFSFYETMTGENLFPIIAVKLAQRGAVVFANGSIYREETIPIIPLESTGAGDAFSAAFLAAWIKGLSLKKCAALGNKVAREVLDVPGTGIDRKKLAHYAL